jgi:hypothetical protein
MEDTVTNRITVKIFIGFEYTIDLKLQLKQTKNWKENSIVKDRKEMRLVEVRYSDKEYIGNYFDLSTVTMKNINEAAQKIRNHLRHYLPELDIEALDIQLFPQVFVS